MKHQTLPKNTVLYEALAERDASWEGVFVAAVRSTGVFCRPGCPARTPKKENVEFFSSPAFAMEAGYRPCKVCRPLESAGRMPKDIETLIDMLKDDPASPLNDDDLMIMGLDPKRVRRWFLKHYGKTFQAWRRLWRLGRAAEAITAGDGIIGAALDAGWESASAFAEAFRRESDLTPTRADERRILTLDRFTSPLGPLWAGATEKGVALLEFDDSERLKRQMKKISLHLNVWPAPGQNGILDDLRAELELYFSGKLQKFSVPLEYAGTPFQRAAWEILKTIPFGETRSYAWQAAELSRPSASRAVAGANGENRIVLIVPCHRVVGSDGRLTGYGGGLWRKKWLLDCEREWVAV